MNEVKAASGVKGKELFHPVRIALTGAHSGPSSIRWFRLMESGSRLPLSTPVLNVGTRQTFSLGTFAIQADLIAFPYKGGSAMQAKKTLLSWSGGKDSAWALHTLRQNPAYNVAAL